MKIALFTVVEESRECAVICVCQYTIWGYKCVCVSLCVWLRDPSSVERLRSGRMLSEPEVHSECVCVVWCGQSECVCSIDSKSMFYRCTHTVWTSTLTHRHSTHQWRFHGSVREDHCRSSAVQSCVSSGQKQLITVGFSTLRIQVFCNL